MKEELNARYINFIHSVKLNTKDAQLFYTENRQNSDYYKTRFAHIFF